MFLLDEPLSALDLKLREGLRAELRQIHRQHRSTMLYATHDYHGAIAIADRLAIIESGVIQQTGTIDEIIALPANMRVGRLIGSPSMAFFQAEVGNAAVVLPGGAQKIPLAAFGETRLTPGRRIVLGVWPEDIEVETSNSAAANAGSVYAVDNRGFERAIQVNADAGSFRKVVPSDMAFKQGDACANFVSRPASCSTPKAARAYRTMAGGQSEPVPDEELVLPLCLGPDPCRLCHALPAIHA